MENNNSFTENEIIKFSPKLENQDIYDSDVEDKINTSNSYSVPTSSMYYNSEEDNSDFSDHNEANPKRILTVANPDAKNSNSQEQLDKSGSIKDKILPTSLTSDDKRKSASLDKKSDIDASSIVVEINDADDDIDMENENSFVVMDQNNNNPSHAENLKKKLEMAENRVSLTTNGDLTYVDNNQTPRNSMDLAMPENSDIVNTNLKRLTDTTSVPPVVNDKIKENAEDVDKATADISNKEHKIAIEDEDEDNTCAICLIETQKPTDIENIGGSNETVVAPTKEDIDNYECKLHCMHKFHYSCIAQWLERNQNCPICRVEIKHYEIEAIEKRFDISIKVKDNTEPLVVPHYNTTIEFDIPLTEELVKNYMKEHFPWINYKTYFNTRFYFYLIGFFFVTAFSIFVSVRSLCKGEKLYFTHYVCSIILSIFFIIFLIEYIYNIVVNKRMLFMIRTPASSSFFYGMVTLLFLVIFISMTYLTETRDKPFAVEKVCEYCIIAFFGIMLLVAYVEAIVCYHIFKEEDRRIVDADVSRRNEEIMERNRREEAEERAEFERNFSHLND